MFISLSAFCSWIFLNIFEATYDNFLDIENLIWNIYIIHWKIYILKSSKCKFLKYCCCEVDGIKLYKWKVCYLLDFLDELTSDGLGPNEWSHIFRSLFYIICIVFQERNLIVGNNMWLVILMWILMLVFATMMIHISASLWQPSGRSGAGTGLEPVGGESLESAGPTLGTHRVVTLGQALEGRGTPLSWFRLCVFPLLLCAAAIKANYLIKASICALWILNTKK